MRLLKALLCVLAALHLLPAKALGLSPPDPVTGARSIGIVVSLARETTAVPWITKRYLETHLREYLVEQIAAPAEGNYHSRPDFPVQILAEESFYAHYESNYDVILICKFRLSDAGVSVQPRRHLLSFACAYDFFDSDGGVLTSYTEKILKTSSVLTSEKDNDQWMDLVHRLQRDFLDRLIARVRGQAGPGLTELRSSIPGAAIRLFNGVRVIEHGGQLCLYDDCLTKNPIVGGTNRTVIGRDLLTQGLTQETDLPGRPRPDIVISDPSDPSEEPRRILFEMSEMQDLQPIGSESSLTIATLAYIFETRYGPGGEMFVSEPHAFIVASDDDAYKQQLKVQFSTAQREIIERLRLAQ